MTDDGRPPRYAGLDGLRRANPVELASDVFVRLFAGASLDRPTRPGLRLERIFVELSGAKSAARGVAGVAGWLGLAPAGPPQLQPFVVETLALWQLTRVAGSRTAGQGVTVLVLMRRGEDLLRSPHPAGHLRDLLLNDPAEY